MYTNVPLFDRLTDENVDNPVESETQAYSTLDGQRELILQNLSRLLNTRVALFWQDYVMRDANPYAYGINATCTVSAENVFEIKQLEKRIDAIIKQFEPRLLNAKSHVVGCGPDPSILFVNIEAEVVFKEHPTLLSFPVVMGM